MIHKNQNNKAPIVFVAGATGYTGREVVRVLAERRIETYAHVRPDSPRLKEWRERFSEYGVQVDTTAWYSGDMTRRFKQLKPTHLICLLGTTRSRMVASKKEGRFAQSESYQSIDCELVGLLTQALLEADLQSRFIYLSAVGVKPWAMSPYFRARWKAEKEVKECGLPYNILRSSIISGPERDDPRILEEWGSRILEKSLSLLSLLGFSRLRKHYAPITNKALSEVLVRVAFDSASLNRVLEPEEWRSV